MWYFIYKMKEKIMRKIRVKIFISQLKNKPKNLKLVGKNHIVNAKNMVLGDNVTIYPNTMFWGAGEIIIGDNVAIGNDTIIYANQKVSIGKNSSIAAQCYIIDSNHVTEKDIPIRNQNLVSKEISIGEDVWIAAGSKVLLGSKINNGAVIGALSLVNAEIEENAICFGIPAKKYKTRT